MKPIYIFDLDGTLALITHRRHFVEGERKDWPAFFKACVNDEPNFPVIDMYLLLREAGCEIRIWSGRSDEVRVETELWLKRNAINGWQELRMRKYGDHKPDETLKAEWLDEMSREDRERLFGIFDDRDRVVAMWRKKGVTCFQVADGNF